MSKRRINKQQSNRIEKIQQTYRQSETQDKNLENGLVLSRYGRHAEIEDKDGNKIHCALRQHLHSLVAGDKVVWQKSGTNQGIVVSRYDRQSELCRFDKRGENKAVAANITQIIIVCAPKPELTWSLLDSYLAMAEMLELKALIVLNKTDLACEDLKQQLLQIYKPLGYRILFTNRDDKSAFLLLEEELKQETSVFVGQSGVGKSSLIATLLPHEEEIQVAEISVNSELGKHTTSNSRYYHLPNGGALIDSPGVREFTLWSMPFSNIIYGFREFRPLVGQCKFRNCNHIDSPGCAVIQSIKNDVYLAKRYESFLKLIK